MLERTALKSLGLRMAWRCEIRCRGGDCSFRQCSRNREPSERLLNMAMNQLYSECHRSTWISLHPSSPPPPCLAAGLKPRRPFELCGSPGNRFPKHLDTGLYRSRWRILEPESPEPYKRTCEVEEVFAKNYEADSHVNVPGHSGKSVLDPARCTGERFVNASSEYIYICIQRANSMSACGYK